MKTVLESVDELILEFNMANAGVRLIHLVLERYQHSSPHQLKDFFKSLFNASYKDEIWKNMLDAKLEHLKRDVDAFFKLFHYTAYNNNKIASFIHDHILKDITKQEQMKIFIGGDSESTLIKRLHYFVTNNTAIPGSDIHDDIKSVIFLKHFGAENDKFAITDVPKFIADVSDLFNSVHLSTNISNIKDKLIDTLVAKSTNIMPFSDTKKMTFFDVAFAEMLIRMAVLDSVIIKVFKQYFLNDNDSSPIPEIEPPKYEPPKYEPQNYDTILPIAGAIGAVGAGLGAYGLYKKYKKNPVSFQNFI